MADFNDYEDSGGADFRTPCPNCGRKFLPESLAKHRGPCERSASKKRKVFDSSKQRTLPGELNLKQLKQSQKTEIPVKKNNWRAKHADFINSIRAAKNAQVAMASGAPLPPPPPPSINPDYVQCPYCSRRFNETAAERHINFCKEQQKRIGNKPAPNPAAKAKQNTRLQYQVPRPKTKSGPASTAGSYGSPGIRTQSSKTGTVPSQGGGRVRSGRFGGGSASSDSDYTQSPTQNRNSNQNHGYVGDVDNYGQTPSPGSASGRALRTGRDAHAYEAAMKDAKMRRPAPSMSKYGSTQSNNMMQNKMAAGPGSKGSPQRKYGNTNAQPGIMYGKDRGNNNNGSHMGGGSRQGSASSRFCHECGTKYPVFSAKFCCECGVRRLGMA